MSVASAFADTIASAGLGRPVISADGRIHRFACEKCSGDGKHGNRHAWYVLHDDGIAAGALGCWRCLPKETWCSKDIKTLTPDDRAELQRRMADAERQRDEEKARAQKGAAALASRVYEAAKPAGPHPYAREKGVQLPTRVRVIEQAELGKASPETAASVGWRGLMGNLLVVPISDPAGAITSLQFIDEEGRKHFLPDGRIRGCSLTIGETTEYVLITEGLATAASLHEATGQCVAIAFNCGNLEAVARAIEVKHVGEKIVVCADNDAATTGNPGLTQARQAARAIGGLLAVPRFPDGVSGTDFNDLHQKVGLDEVRRQIRAAGPADDSTEGEIPPMKSTPTVDGELEQKGYTFGDAKEPAPTAPVSVSDRLAELRARDVDAKNGIGAACPEKESSAAVNSVDPVLIRLADVQPVPLEWLWKGRIPRGKLTILDGDPGTGKSMLSLDLAARVTKGSPMPDGSPGVLGGVVLMAGEDDPADTIRPRFDAAGGDPAQVVILQGLREVKTGEVRPPNVRDIAAIQGAVNEVQARLVIVDPIMAYLGGADSHVDADVRAALHHLVELAQTQKLAVILIRHLNKSLGGNPLYRGGGSIGIVATARSGLLVAKDPDDPEGGRRILTATKCNLAEMPRAISYSIQAVDGTARILWGAETDHQAADLLQPADMDERSSLPDAVAWLREELAAGPVPSAKVVSHAKLNDISERTLKRAKKAAGVRAIKNGLGPWHWTLETDTFGTAS